MWAIALPPIALLTYANEITATLTVEDTIARTVHHGPTLDAGWTFAPVSAIVNVRTSLSPWAMAPKARGCFPWAFTLSALS